MAFCSEGAKLVFSAVCLAVHKVTLTILKDIHHILIENMDEASGTQILSIIALTVFFGGFVLAILVIFNKKSSSETEDNSANNSQKNAINENDKKGSEKQSEKQSDRQYNGQTWIETGVETSRETHL